MHDAKQVTPDGYGSPFQHALDNLDQANKRLAYFQTVYNDALEQYREAERNLNMANIAVESMTSTIERFKALEAETADKPEAYRRG